MILAPDPLTHTRDLAFILDFSLSLPPNKVILNPLDSFSGSPFPCCEPCLHPAVSCNAPDFPTPSLLDDNSWKFPFKKLVNNFSIDFWVKSAQTSENQATSSMQPHEVFPSHFSLFSFGSQSRFYTPPTPQDSVHISWCFPLSSWLSSCLKCISLCPNAACPSQLAQMLLPTWSLLWSSNLRASFSSSSLLKTLEPSRTLWGSPRY